MIKTVGRSFNWASPTVINNMFCDNEDWEGIVFWYNDVKDQHREIDSKNKK